MGRGDNVVCVNHRKRILDVPCSEFSVSIRRASSFRRVSESGGFAPGIVGVE